MGCIYYGGSMALTGFSASHLRLIPRVFFCLTDDWINKIRVYLSKSRLPPTASVPIVLAVISSKKV